MQFICSLTQLVLVTAIPVDWNFPPLRNITMPPVIQRFLDEEKFTVVGTGTEGSSANITVKEFTEKSSTENLPSGPAGDSQSTVNCLTLLCIEHLLGYVNPSSSTNIQDYFGTTASTILPMVNVSMDTKSAYEDMDMDFNYGLLAKAALIFLGSLPGFLLVLIMTLGKIREAYLTYSAIFIWHCGRTV